LLAARQPQAAGEQEARCGDRATRLFLGGQQKEMRMSNATSANRNSRATNQANSPITGF
jgi:hypothetical protein